MGATGWISMGGLIVSMAAFWRSGSVRVVDLRTNVRKEIAELRVILDDLLKQIPHRVQSRERAWATIGLATSGAMVEFRNTADGHVAEIQQLRAQLDHLEPIPRLATYTVVENRAVAERTIRSRTQQLLDKYAAAAREDDATREHARKAALDRVGRS